MNRINQLFERKEKNILSVYFVAGAPELDNTVPVIGALAEAGVDMVEIGIPFSDPMADGPVIQQSATVALRNGMTLSRLFDQLKDIRSKVEIPLVLMGYLNPIMQYGVEPFCAKCRETGIDGVIIPDLPFADYLAEYKPLGDKYGVKFIMLITPETSEERIRLIDAHTEGFVYMVSTASTTGAKDRFGEDTVAYFRKIDGMNLRNPRLIGFGISNRQTLEGAMSYAGGAIVGSSFVKLLASEKEPRRAVKKLLEQLAR